MYSQVALEVEDGPEFVGVCAEECIRLDVRPISEALGIPARHGLDHNN